MPKIASVKDFHARYDKRNGFDSNPTVGRLREVVRLASKEGFAFHKDGRAYVPEALRGKGVGYGKHGA